MTDSVKVTNLIDGLEQPSITAGLFSDLVSEVEDHNGSDGDSFVLRFFGEGSENMARGYVTWKNRIAEAEWLDPRDKPGRKPA